MSPRLPYTPPSATDILKQAVLAADEEDSLQPESPWAPSVIRSRAWRYGRLDTLVLPEEPEIIQEIGDQWEYYPPMISDRLRKIEALELADYTQSLSFVNEPRQRSLQKSLILLLADPALTLHLLWKKEKKEVGLLIFSGTLSTPSDAQAYSPLLKEKRLILDFKGLQISFTLDRERGNNPVKGWKKEKSQLELLTRFHPDPAYFAKLWGAVENILNGLATFQFKGNVRIHAGQKNPLASVLRVSKPILEKWILEDSLADARTTPSSNDIRPRL